MPQLAGEDILASDIKVPLIVNKAIAETRANSTYANDADFSVPLTVGVYDLELYYHALGLSSATLGGFKGKWVNTGTMTSRGRSCRGPAFGFTFEPDAITTFKHAAYAFGSDVTYGVNDSITALIHESLTVEVTVAGTLTYQWAQQATTATVTSASASSRLIITTIEDF